MTAGSNGSSVMPSAELGHRRVLPRKDEARQFAEKIAADEQFGERAREILARLGTQP